VSVADSVWMTPDSSCMCMGEMQGCEHRAIPPYVGSPFQWPCLTAGSITLMPMPAGTGTPLDHNVKVGMHMEG
jgi:hypothetical protein